MTRRCYRPYVAALVVMLGVLVVGLACGAVSVSPKVAGGDIREFTDVGYVIFVDCIVDNSGPVGRVVVAAELTGGGFWQKERSVLLDDGEIGKMVTLSFPEAEPLPEGLAGFEFECLIGKR